METSKFILIAVGLADVLIFGLFIPKARRALPGWLYAVTFVAINIGFLLIVDAANYSSLLACALCCGFTTLSTVAAVSFIRRSESRVQRMEGSTTT